MGYSCRFFDILFIAAYVAAKTRRKNEERLTAYRVVTASVIDMRLRKRDLNV